MKKKPDHSSFEFSEMMPTLIREILMIASPYDRFILEEDGRFSDRMLTEYSSLDISFPPHFSHVSSAGAALEKLKKKRYDLVVTTSHCSDLPPRELAATIAERHPGLPVVMLTYDRAEAETYLRDSTLDAIPQVFLWTGEPTLLVALVKCVEDFKNVEHDTAEGMVRVIVVVEDDPAFFSAFLPEMYREILAQFHSLLPHRLNERDRQHRMRVRPKILLARNYDEATALIELYREYLLGIVCDVSFPRQGVMDETAGLTLVGDARKKRPDLPVLLLSTDKKFGEIAHGLDIHFAHKKTSMREIGDFMKHNFGFGSFVFKLPNGEVVGEAGNMEEMLSVLKQIPVESIEYHARKQDFSNWLMARSEFDPAMEVKYRQVEEFRDLEEVRDYLIEVFSQFLYQRQRGQVTDLPKVSSLLTRDFIRVGRGSMGGKSRGIAFVAHMLAESPINQKYPGIHITVPRTAVICTDYYDRFCARNDLAHRALEADSDEEVTRLFLEQELDDELLEVVEKIVTEIDYPLAVRSSSLLEDSSFHPLAGLYDTFILPNSADSFEIRMQQLSRAIRLVMASSFFKEARRFLAANAFRPEREKMAVVIQRLVGQRFGDLFYPDFAGVAQSHNYYPLGYIKPEDGIVTVALGLGYTVVDGRRALRFSPKHPNVLPQMSTSQEALNASQRDFFALSLADPERMPDRDTAVNLVLEGLSRAEKDGTLRSVGATWSKENDVIYDSIYRAGVRIVNFAGVLKYDRFPLAPLVSDLLDLCSEGMGASVEIEFAVALDRNGRPAELAVLELRPLMGMGHEKTVSLDNTSDRSKLLLAGKAMGNGITGNIRDVVYIHPDRFELNKSELLAREIGILNYQLARANRPYLLMGPGRWGTADPWLGIPVVWGQVSGAKTIVELELPHSHIVPSQGTHFFHNLSSLKVGYFCINAGNPKHYKDLDWLEGQKVEKEVMGIRHVVLPNAIETRIDGRCGRGVVIHGGE
ncbi:MAG: PEP/pyruvate-binding domain-containing protein [Acidobacteriota bacterium]|nr:PEP/pyruvate-binding domain-containing protein [Acidobacteriota bacterium]